MNPFDLNVRIKMMSS